MAITYGRDWAYAHDRLRGTIVRHDGRPAVIQSVNSRGETAFNYLGYTVVENDHLDNFNLDPVPLGYINMNNTAKYIGRMPARQYRQGVRHNTIIGKDGGRVPYNEPDLFNCIVGSYPGLETCIELVYNGEFNRRAWTKKYAIGRHNRSKTLLTLLYKDKDVGTIRLKDLKPTLKKHYIWLKEDLEALLKC